MKTKIKFLKLFSKLGECEDASLSFIAYRKNVFEKDDFKVTKYKYNLYINLWLIYFRFFWIKNKKNI